MSFNNRKKIPVFVLVLGLLSSVWPLGAGEMLRLESSAEAMGSSYSIVIYDEDRGRMESAAEMAFDEVRRLDGLLSNYKPDSAWSQVNQHAAEKPVEVPPDLFDLLAACVEYSRRR